AHSQDWQTKVTPGQKILVCDVGGGTSDFTLIRVRQSQAEADHGAVQFHRVAVGDHLILGGDNLDLALAHYLDQKLGQPLQPRQWDVLVRSCRHVKETLLGDNPPERTTVHLPGSGAKLIGGGLQIEVTRDEAEQVLVEGFFPQVTLEDKPQTKKSGFQEFGLPYASDPAVTKYIAAFLTAHRHVDSSAADSTASDGPDPARPDLILFNGGLFCSPLIQFRIVQAIRNWFKTDQDPTWSPVVLQNDRLDLAVAKGAAYYGMVRRGEGVRIAAGLARSYYVGVANEANQLDHAVCLVPGRTQPGETVDLTQHQFDLRISEPVEFPLFVSSVRLADEPGQALPIDLEQMRPLPPIRTALKSRRRSDVGTVPVQLHARLSEIGTIEMWCAQVDQDRQWRLQFDVRSALETDRAAIASTGEGQGTLDDQTWEECQWLIEETFGDAGKRKPRELVSSLADVLQAERHAWPMSVLRRIWESLLDHQEGRKKSQAHEARWLNLAGYSLRPGYGMAVDDWRVAETWRLVNGKLAFNSPVCRSETWILWRRIAGGLTAGQQKALAEPLLSSVRSLHRRMVGGHVKGDVNFNLPESAEMWRLLGSLEWLPRSTKRDLGEMILELAWKRKCEAVRPAMIWAVGRLGARTPVYGPLNTVVDAAVAEPWIRQLMEHEVDTVSALAAMQLGRRTSDRHRDISDSGRSSLVDWLGAFSPNYAKLVSDVVELNQEQQGQVFGESLPVGLRIR
ncbi:MAG: molecular chaperone DnaK, partial [Planctomycetales bacterium]|nr:molecular chaperone DnaK [Planctomycetales bacterium]